MIRCFEVIGEAVKQLSPEIRKKYPEITWRKIAGFRDILIHSYTGINVDEVWGVIKDNLPKMNYPAASGRGIRIKIDSIVDFGVAAGILYLVLLHISLSYLHPHAFLPYLRNIHHSKTLLPTTAFSLEDTF